MRQGWDFGDRLGDIMILKIESFLLPEVSLEANRNCIKFLVSFTSTAKNACNGDLSQPFEPIWICIISSKRVLDSQLENVYLELVF